MTNLIIFSRPKSSKKVKGPRSRIIHTHETATEAERGNTKLNFDEGFHKFREKHETNDTAAKIPLLSAEDGARNCDSHICPSHLCTELGHVLRNPLSNFKIQVSNRIRRLIEYLLEQVGKPAI